MLRLSKMTDYGTVIMSQMAAHPLEVYSAAQVAAAAGLSATTASKILKTLARHELLTSIRGSKGGYMLSRPPERISVADVIAALEGSVSVTECGVPSGQCTQEARCPSRDNWRRLNEMVRGILSGVTLRDMAVPLPHPLVLSSGAKPSETGMHHLGLTNGIGNT